MNRAEITTEIRATREAKGMTYYQLTKKTGVILNQLKNIEGNKVNFTVDSLLKILEALEIEIELKHKY